MGSLSQAGRGEGQGADLTVFAEGREGLAIEADVERGGVAGLEDEMVRGAKLAGLSWLKSEVKNGDAVGHG